jgi:glycosyltransferase involved in cell wall biosynthesis
VHVLMPTDGPMVELYQAAGIVVHEGQASLPLKFPHRWRHLYEAIRSLTSRIEPDLIHSHFVGTTLSMRLALGKHHKTPRVFQVPGPLHLEHPFFRNMEIRTASDKDYWIGSCNWTCERYQRSGISSDRIFKSYYGSDLEEIQVRHPGRLRSELGISDSTQIVGMVAFMYGPKRYLGQSRGLKGHEDLIDALTILRSQGRNVVGVFVGGAWAGATAYENRVRAYGESRLGDAAHFLGSRQDVPYLYPDFDVVAHPSHSENVGGAAESQLLAIPTVATNVGGFPDLVVPGETGWLVPPRSPHELADAIAEALDDPVKAKRFAVSGQALATDLFDVRRTGKEVLGIYEQILSK